MGLKLHFSAIILLIVSLFLFITTVSSQSICQFPEYPSPPQKALSVISKIIGHSYELLNNLFGFCALIESVDYHFVVGICKSFTNGIQGVASDVGIYYYLRNDKKIPREIKSIGSFKNSDLHVNSISDFVVLEYDNGDNNSASPSHSKYHSTIIIRCLTSTNAPCTSLEFCLIHISRELNVSGLQRPESHFLFELYHKDVCDELAKGQAGSPNYRSESSGLSLGSWLLVICGTLFLLYLGVGVGYKALVMGARGAELVPNRAFWVEWGNLVADGCEAVFRSPESRAKYAGRGLFDDEYQPGRGAPGGARPGARQPALLRDVDPLGPQSAGARDRSGYAQLSDPSGGARGILTDESADDQQILPM